MAIQYQYPRKNPPVGDDLVLISDSEDTLNPNATKTVTIQSIIDLDTSVLPSANIFVGNASNLSTAVAMSGDVTITNTGATTVGTINSIAVATVTNGAAAGAIALPLAGGAMSGTIAGNQNIIGKMPTIIDTNATLTLQDNVHEGAFLYSNSASPTTITIDPFSSEPFTNGTEIKIMRGGSSPSLSVTPGSGVTLNGGTGSIAIGSAYGTLTIKQLEVNTWVGYV
tara:strand:- start:1155 stop:1829 length:675 start_codon:yes stop_codon:yes gene_type:complete